MFDTCIEIIWGLHPTCEEDEITLTVPLPIAKDSPLNVSTTSFPPTAEMAVSNLSFSASDGML